jgi:hypothetical protein
MRWGPWRSGGGFECPRPLGWSEAGRRGDLLERTTNLECMPPRWPFRLQFGCSRRSRSPANGTTGYLRGVDSGLAPC